MKELGTAPVGKLLKQYALPSIVAMTASSLYNMVDSIFIGHIGGNVGPLALGALAVTFPFMNLGAAFGSLVGVGASTMISVKLGQKDYDTARRVLGNVVMLNLIIGMAFMILSLIFLDSLLRFFGASDATIGYASDYMKIILYGNVVTHMYLGLNSASRAAGSPNRAMYATILTVCLNACLDPLFIFTFGLGIKGAAIATILAQVVSLTWLLAVFSKPEHEVHFVRKSFRLDRHIVRKSLAIGMSPFMMNAAACIITIFINRELLTYGGDMDVAAYGIVNRVLFVFAMIVLGLNQGMQPIAGYNYGARQMDRVFEARNKTILSAVIVTSLAFVVGEFLPAMVANVFTDDPVLTEKSVRAMRIASIAWPLVGYSMVISNFFQSLGLPKQSIFLSLTRQIIYLLPLLVVLPRFFGTDGVWYAMAVSDVLAFITSVAVMQYNRKKFVFNDMCNSAD
ncbi:MAG: MATE family efflux transporter [Paludibacteraceae bacterium]|nr:MATE family efflux transporter [Paludibacteraceae bacterium]